MGSLIDYGSKAMYSHLKDVRRTLASPPPKMPGSALAQKNGGTIITSLYRAIPIQYHTNELDKTARRAKSTRGPLREGLVCTPLS